MPDSEPLSSQQRPRTRLRPWRDAAAVGGLLLAANALTAPHDPGWFLLNPSPWLLLPGLMGMRHGFRWGFLIGSAASLAVLGMLSVFQPGLPGVNLIYFLSLPAAGLLSGAAHRLEGEPVNELVHRPAPAQPSPDSAEVLLRGQLEESAGTRRELAARLEEREAGVQGLAQQCEEFSRQSRELSRQQETLRQERDALSAELARRTGDLRAMEEKQELLLRQHRQEEAVMAKAMASRSDADTAAAMEETRLALEREILQAAVERRDAVRAYVERRRTASDRLAEREARHGQELQALHSERDSLSRQLAQATLRLAERGNELERMISRQGETDTVLAGREHSLNELASRLEVLDGQVVERDRMIQSLRLELEQRMAARQVEEAQQEVMVEDEPALAVSLLSPESHDAPRTETLSEAAGAGGTVVTCLRMGGDTDLDPEPPLPSPLQESAAPQEQEEHGSQQQGERAVVMQQLEQELSECRKAINQLTVQRDELAARLEERLDLLEILTEERAVLTDKLAERGEALRKVEAVRDSLTGHPDHRNALLKPVTARALPLVRRMPRRSGGVRHQDAPALETADDPDGIPPRLAVEEGRDFLSGMTMPAALDGEEASLELSFRALFEAGAGPVFPHLLMLLEETAGVTDAAFYQIDGTRLERSALRGEGGMLPKTMPLATAEIAALAVARQSFVTCRQVWATVPAQDSPWLAALPWPSDGFHSTALLLIHRMHLGQVNRRTFSRIQLICRWAARFMELHGLPGTGSEPVGGALTVTPDVLRRALLDAAAAYREHGLLSSTLTLRLNGEARAHQEHLLSTVLAHLRPTDLVCQGHSVVEPDPASPTPAPTGSAGVAMEILLTFSSPGEAEEIAGPLDQAITGDPVLRGVVTLSPPALVGG